MTLAERLHGLPAATLKALLARRPEAAALAAVSEPSWDALARRLVEPRGILGAIAALNRFQRALLELGCLAGGGLGPVQAEREGLAPADFEIGVRQLEEAGLGFRERDGTLTVLPQVGALLPSPGGLGPPAETLLRLQTVEFLREIAGQVGILLSNAPRRKAELVDLIRPRLGDQAVVRALLGSAPPAAARAFAELRRGNGSADLGEISDSPRDWSWRWQPELARDGPWWLARRGLALPTDPGRMRLAIPAETELALRGRLFPSWSPVEPELSLRPLREPRHPLELVTAMAALLRLWRREPPPAIQSGGPGKRELRRAAQALRIAAAAAAALAGLGFDLGLLTEIELVPEKKSRARRNPRVLQPRRAVVTVTPEAAAWEELAEPERWLELTRGRLLGIRSARLEGALEVLLDLPAGKGAPAAELGRLLDWRWPALFDGSADATALALTLGDAFEFLAAGGAEPAIGLGAAGRAALAASGPDLEALRAALPAETDLCTVTADHRVIVAGRPSLELERALSRLAEVESVQPARVYRLSEASLRAAFDSGLGAPELIELLSRHAGAAIPANVVTLIEDLGRRHGRLRIGPAGLYLRTDDPAQLEELVRMPGLRALGLRAIAPTVAVVESDDLEAVVGQLRRAGQMPVVEGAAPPAPAPPARRRRPAPEEAVGAVGAAKLDLEALAAALQRGPRPGAAPAPAAQSGRDALYGLLESAVRSRRPLEVGYKNGPDGPLQVLEVRPLRFERDRLEALDDGGGRVWGLDARNILWATEIGQDRLQFELEADDDLPDPPHLLQLPRRRR